eukprot:gnl/MRDRNA2_/MRDRNA2_68127_c0_seq1.p1 gnl/MRDRNA2_/MRDRNA2_68127_c0~~gnl/MRDRNA2_/MRDRNA2_68127_c0_seq1.p1  ORF type:complete len:110 (-),score=3.27 gnl/MRDRNA2_/MRDRNA2_68127_c0_seq1:10-339(-)
MEVDGGSAAFNAVIHAESHDSIRQRTLIKIAISEVDEVPDTGAVSTGAVSSLLSTCFVVVTGSDAAWHEHVVEGADVGSADLGQDRQIRNILKLFMKRSPSSCDAIIIS